MDTKYILTLAVALFAPVIMLLDKAYARTFGAGKQEARLRDIDKAIAEARDDYKSICEDVKALKMALEAQGKTLSNQDFINKTQDKINEKFDKLQSAFDRMSGREQRREGRQDDRYEGRQ